MKLKKCFEMDSNSFDDDGAILNIVLYGRSSWRYFESFSSFINTVCHDVEATTKNNLISFLDLD